MVARRARRQKAPTGRTDDPSRTPGAARQPEPTEGKGAVPDDVEFGRQNEVQTGKVGSQGILPEELEEAWQEEFEPADRGHPVEDKGLDR